MLDDLVSVIETLQQRIRDYGASLRENETRTRMALIDPLLTTLGWDVSDPALVTPEYSVGAGRADYALIGSEAIPAAMVEAKRLGHNLSDDERMQMLNYANARGVRYAAVTDGDVWEFYEVFKQAPLEDRRQLSLRIANTRAHELALRLLLLWRPNLASGQPVVAREPLFGFEEALHPLTPSVPEVQSIQQEPAPVEPDWISLSSFHPTTGASAPTSVRFSDGSVWEVTNWRSLVVGTIKWLWSKHLLTQDKLPVRRSSNSKRYIVHTEPVHGTGTNFYHSVPIEGTPLFFDGNVGVSAPNRARTLLEHCGVNPDTVQLQVGQ